MSETEDPRLPDKHRSSEPKDIDNEQDIQSTLSAVQSNDAIKFIKGRIIATNRLLRTLETAKKESSEDKARIASLVEEVAALNQSKLELEKELTTARIDLGRLRETSINVESQLSARVQEVEAQLKKSTDRERQVEPVKQNNGKEDFLVVQLKARVDDLQEQLKESEQKIRKRANAAAKSKDEEIARLKQELAKKESEAKRAGDEFMEIEVKNMMLESDLTEAKEDLEAAHSELNTLREEMRVLKEHENITNDQNDNNTHEALVAAHREITVLRNELGHRYQENKKLAAKLAKNEDHLSKRDAMETDNDVNNANGQVLHLRSKDRRSVTPAGQGQQHLMNELRRLMEENAKLHKQKRVLQEKLTEQLVINAESQAASLSFPSSSPSYLVSEGRRISYDNDYDKSFDAGSVDFPASVSDISRTSSRFEENGPKYAVCDKTLKQQLHTTLPVTSSRPQTARSSPTPSPCSPLLQSNPPPAFKRSLSIDTNPSTSSASSSSALPAVSSPATQTTPSTGVPTTASTNTLTKTSSAAAMNASTKALLRDQSMVVPESSVTVPSSSKMTRKARPSKLEKFAKARLPSSMASLSRKRTTPTPEKASSASEKRTTKRVKMTPIPESESKIVPNTDTVTLLKARIEEFAKETPDYISQHFDEMNELAKDKLDLLLACLDGFYQSLKSHGNPISKNTTFTYLQYGITNYMLTCPTWWDHRERNIAWFLYFLIAKYDKQDLYDKVLTWAIGKAFSHIKASKVNLSCRYARLISVLCRTTNDLQRLRCFCYDLCRTMPLESNVLTTTLNVALVCPIILSLHKPPEVNAAGTDLVIKTLESVMARKTVTEPLKNIYRTLSNILGWRSLEQVPPLENVIKEFATLFQIEDFKVLSTLNPAAFEDLRFNLVKSLELAFYHMTHWNIVYDDFVRNVVWPMMNEEALADIALELMVLLGQFGLPKNDTEQEKKGVRFIRDRLLHILSVTDMPPEDLTIQVTAARGMLVLHNNTISNIRPILTWFEALPSTSKSHLPNDFCQHIVKIQTALRMLR